MVIHQHPSGRIQRQASIDSGPMNVMHRLHLVLRLELIQVQLLIRC